PLIKRLLIYVFSQSQFRLVPHPARSAVTTRSPVVGMAKQLRNRPVVPVHGQLAERQEMSGRYMREALDHYHFPPIGQKTENLEASRFQSTFLVTADIEQIGEAISTASGRHLYILGRL